MKKIISLVLALVLCLCLCACGKSDAHVAFENLVNQIGTVSLESEEAITAAEEAYKALSEEDKSAAADVQATLADMRKTYDELVVEAERKAEQDARLAAVVELIEAIGNVTVDSEEAIIAAETAYEELPEEEKAMIADAAKTLTDSRTAYNDAVAAQTAAEAAEVEAAINKIGNVSLSSKDAIQAAKTAYDALSADAKNLVTNYKVLEDAQNKYDTLWSAEKQRIITEYTKKFEKDSDPVEGITWYMHKNMPDYIDSRCYIIPYIGVRGNSPWLCIRYNYTNDDWIFWENLHIVVDGQKYYKAVGYFNTTRDNDTEVWEYYDEALDVNQAMNTKDIEMLKAIANSSETIIRFEGDDYHYDLYVSKKDKDMIRDALALYEALLG